ncbi:MAG: type II secretion system minor pseudopilin GspJ [Rhodospirillaceae bacterium]
MSRTESGFTLVEVLVTLAVFSMLSLIGGAVLNQSLNAKAQSDQMQHSIEDLQITRATLKADLSQISLRATRDAYGAQEPVVFAGGDTITLGTVLKLVRDGWQNPLGQDRRSSLQRVDYILENETLLRRAYPRLDGQSADNAQTQVLLKGVENLSVSFLIDGQWRTSWMVPARGPYVLPDAVALDLETQNLGALRQVFMTSGLVL